MLVEFYYFWVERFCFAGRGDKTNAGLPSTASPPPHGTHQDPPHMLASLTGGMRAGAGALSRTMSKVLRGKQTLHPKP